MNKNLFICLLLFFLAPFTLWCQGPYCPGYPCLANDVNLTAAKLVDANGNPVLKVFCEDGDIVPNLFLSLTFQVNANIRYKINFTADLMFNGVYVNSFSFCLGDLTGPMSYTFQLQQIPWACDATVSLNNSLISWQNVYSPGDVCMTCTTPSKCDRYNDPFSVTCPLACSFNVSKVTGSGIGSLSRAVFCSTAGDTIRFDSLLLGDTITTSTIYINSGQGPVVLKCNFSPHICVYSNAISFEVPNGGSLEALNVNFIGSLNGVLFSNKYVHALINLGILKLKNVELFQYPQIPSPGILIYNSSTGQLIIPGGNVKIH